MVEVGVKEIETVCDGDSLAEGDGENNAEAPGVGVADSVSEANWLALMESVTLADKGMPEGEVLILAVPVMLGIALGLSDSVAVKLVVFDTKAV